jgi:hypothetical protein
MSGSQLLKLPFRQLLLLFYQPLLPVHQLFLLGVPGVGLLQVFPLCRYGGPTVVEVRLA